MEKKVFVAGAGGFIGGHIVKELLNKGYDVKAADIKPLNEWFQLFEEAHNFQKDLSDKNNCFEMVKGTNEVINMACNMGGMGFPH